MTSRIPLLRCLFLPLLTLASSFLAFSCRKAETVSSESVKGSPPIVKVNASLEKGTVTLGIVTSTDSTAIVTAKAKAFFDEEGLSVTLRRFSSHEALFEDLTTGRLDGGLVLAGQALNASLSAGAEVVTPYVAATNGDAITISDTLWAEIQQELLLDDTGQPIRPIGAEVLESAAQEAVYRASPMTFYVDSIYSPAHYLLRYWLAAAGLEPSSQMPSGPVSNQLVKIETTDSQNLLEALRSGKAQGFASAQPWNQQAVDSNAGVTVATGNEVHRNHQGKLFGVTAGWAKENPKTLLALTKALIRAGRWLDDSVENRRQAATWLAESFGLAESRAVLERSLVGELLVVAEPPLALASPDFHVFARYDCAKPSLAEGAWVLSQMIRWGQAKLEPNNDRLLSLVKRVYHPEIYDEAADQLVEQGLFPAEAFPSGQEPTSITDFIDGNEFNPSAPGDYAAQWLAK